MWGEAGVHHVDEMGWSMKEIGELQHNVKYMTNHNEIVQNQFKILQRLHLVPFGFPLKDLKSSWCTRVFVHLKGFRSREGKEVQWWLAQRFGCAKGPNGLSKGQALGWTRWLTTHDQLWWVDVFKWINLYCQSRGYGVTTHDISISTDPGLHHELLGQRRCLNAVWKSATGDFFCWKGYHNSNGPLVDAIKEVRQYGKRWQMSLAKSYMEGSLSFSMKAIWRQKTFRWQDIHALQGNPCPGGGGHTWADISQAETLEPPILQRVFLLVQQCVFTKCPSKR